MMDKIMLYVEISYQDLLGKLENKCQHAEDI